MALRGHRLLAVVERIEPPELLEWFAEQRAAIGIDVVPLGPDVSRTVLRALRDNRIVCLLSDRDIEGDGVEVEFFGERTTLPGRPGDARAAHRGDTGAGRGLLSPRPRPPRGGAAADRGGADRVACAKTSRGSPRCSRTSSSC